MANAIFTKGKEKILSGQINFSTDSLKAVIVSSAYAPSLSTHEFLDSASASVLGSAVTLTGKSVAGGVFNADDINIQAVAAGATAKAVVVFKDSGDPATSPLLLYIDQVGGFPAATNGGDITIQWDNGAYKIFSL